MEKTNTNNYNTPYSKVNNFKNFNADTEIKDLGKTKRSFVKNYDDVYELPNNNKMYFNKVTKTMQSLSKDEINDKIEAAEEYKEDDKKANESVNSPESFLKMMSKDVDNHLSDIEPLIKKSEKKDKDTYNQLLQIKKDLENIKHNIKNK